LDRQCTLCTQHFKQEEKDILSKFAPAEVRIAEVHMSVEFMNQSFKIMMPFYVRVSGARGRLFGFGEPKGRRQRVEMTRLTKL
jgi:hypothetical protein